MMLGAVRSVVMNAAALISGPRTMVTGAAGAAGARAGARALAAGAAADGGGGSPTAAEARAVGYPRPVQLILEHGAAALRAPPGPLPTRRERVEQQQRRAVQLQERKAARASGARPEFAHRPPMVSALQAARARKVFRMEGWYARPRPRARLARGASLPRPAGRSRRRRVRAPPAASTGSGPSPRWARRSARGGGAG